MPRTLADVCALSPIASSRCPSTARPRRHHNPRSPDCDSEKQRDGRAWTCSSTRRGSSSPSTVCPCLPVEVIDTPEAAREVAAAARRPRGRQGAGQDRWPRQGRRREAGRRPGRRGRQGRQHPRHGHQGPHRPQGDAGPDRGHRRGVLRLVPARPRQPHLPRHVLRRGRHGDRGGRGHQARGARQGPGRRARGRRPTPRPARSSRRRSSRPRSPTRSSTSCRSCGTSSSRRTPRWSRSTR